MKWATICKRLGLPIDSSYIKVRLVYRSQMALARRYNDTEKAIRLSQLNQAIKARVRPKCIDCGIPLYRESKSGRCRMHMNIARFYGSRLNERTTPAVRSRSGA